MQLRTRFVIKAYIYVFLLLGILLGFLAGFITGETLASRMQECSYHYGNQWDSYPKPKPINDYIRNDL